MKFPDYFDDFLENEVNLNPTRMSLLNARVEAITNFLRASETFKSYFIEVIPQGSYAHKTIIRPVCENDEFDADVLFELTEVDGWEACEYIEKLYATFHNSGIYKGKARRRTRCVVVNYAGDFHIDVVPYMERHGSKYITNRHENAYQLTDPESFNEWLEEKDRITAQHFVRVVRLVKYLRDFKNRFSVKSIILSTLLGGRVNYAALLEDPNCYEDVPSTLRTVMNRLSEYVEDNEDLPTIEDPAGTGEYFNDRWDQEGWANFRKWIIHYAEKIEQAYTEEDEGESLKKWQVVFGPAFKAPMKKAAEASLVRFSEGHAVRFDDTEQFLERDFGIQTVLRPEYYVRISGKVLEERGFRSKFLARRGNNVERKRRIQFFIKACNVPQPYEIYWKVRNVGPAAEAMNMIRGQIKKGGDTWGRAESTDFVGPHYVECYIVKNNVCVARDRQPVNIL